MPPTRPFVLFALLSALTGPAVAAAEVETPPRDKEPLLRIDPGGPASFVTALAFSPDGQTLYAGGWDKVIRTWTLNAKGDFEPSPSLYRVPVGPGLDGAINALALSPDGNWLAAAGNGMARQTAGFRELGFLVPASGARDAVMLRDVGTIYLFNTGDRTVRILRGHRGHVTALAFGPRRGKAPPLLLSVAEEEMEGNAAQTQLTARLWDPDRGELVATLPELPGKALGGRRPGAALWDSGEGADKMRAALVLHDGNLRIWDPTRKQTRPWQGKDLLHNLGVAYLAGRERLLTAGYDSSSRRSQLALWRVPTKDEPKRERRADVGEGYARALALLSRKSDGVPDLAAVLVLIPGQQGAAHRYVLRLVDLAGANFHIVPKKEVPLWKDRDARQPVVAASPRGGHFAVAGDPDHTIRVYGLRSLLNEEKPSLQILRGNALTFRHASFVRRGKNLGLLLNRAVRKKPGEAPPQPDEKQGDWIFDFGKRRLSDGLAGWETAHPPAGGWRAEYDGATKSIAVQDGGKPIGKVSLPAKEELTDYALLPPTGPVKVPLLAVAAHHNGQPRLAVYNAKSGQPLRECTGHTERLRSLAFAADGRLLVSTADDGTVRVWSLTDLNTVLGQHGRLPGIVVGPADKGAKAVKVREVADDSPARGKLKSGDVLVGLVEQNKLRRLDSPRAFYEALYLLKPGEQIGLRRGDPDGKEDIPLVVGQGIDERKPLFSLLAIGAAKAADCEWIGWSPVGPYEASSPKAEKYLGWHFNTGDAKAPTRFAGAGQYRKFYYRADLLNQLLKSGALGRVESLRLPPPWIGLWVKEDGRLLPREGQAPVVVHRPRIDFKVALGERPLSSLKSLTWRLDDGPETELDLDNGDEAPFQIPLTLSRGDHRFAVTAHTRDVFPQPTRESLIVRYRPLPPELAHADAGRQLHVREAKYGFRADITPRMAGEDVRVLVFHRHPEGEEKPYTRTFAGREVIEGAHLRLEQELKLRPGNNEVEVVAVNGGAPDGGREQETARLTLSVFYYFKAKPPTITFERVVPVSARGEARPLAASSSRPLVVHLPVIKLVGVLKTGEEPLTEAVWDRGKSTKATRFARFEPGKRVELSFEERISLSPEKGEQTIRVRTRTKNSDEVERRLILVYQPPLPVMTDLTAPRDGEVRDGRGEPQTLAVRGRVRLPEGATDYQAAILVNGKPAAEPAVLDEKAGTLTGKAVIGPGENRIQVKLSNRWGASDSSAVVLVRYVRPPVFVGGLKHKAVPSRPLVDLEAEVFSPVDLDRASVRAVVNGQPSAANEVRLEALKAKKDHWTVRLLGVAIDAGSREQKVVLRLGNVEAEARAAVEIVVQSAAVLPPPRAEFLQPRRDTAVSTPRLMVRFQVRSEGDLERVRLLQEGRPPLPINTAGALREGTRRELMVAREVELQPGTNRLSVEAVSVSGRLPDATQLVVTYVPPPLRVEIERMTELRAAGVSVEVRRDARGQLVLPKVSSGRVRLHGRIVWANPAVGKRGEPFVLRVFVNGFQQLPIVRRRRSGEATTSFEAPLLLNRARDNRIRLVFSADRAGEPAECRVDCGEPATRLRLHVLVLSPHAKPERIEDEVRKAIDPRRREGGQPATAFEEVRIAATLTGSKVFRQFIYFQLVQLKEEIVSRQMTALGRQDTPKNDVLMIYYEGGEAIDDKGHFFETHAPPGSSARFGMSCDELAHFLAELPGAQVLLLDVERPATAANDRGRDKIARWKDDYPDARIHVVVMRCARRQETGGVRLIPVLRQTLPRAGRLSELTALVEKTIAQAGDQNLLVFTSYLPTELADLTVGPPP